MAMAEPMAVPSSIVPTFTRSRFCWSQSWSSVSGLTRYGAPANSTRPRRSLGRSSMNFETTDLTTPTRSTGSPLTLKSSDCMEPETSMASIMSMPLALTSCRGAAKLRTRQRHHEQPQRKEGQQRQPATGAAAGFAGHLARGFGAGEFDGGHRALAPTPEGDEWQEKEQPQPTGLKKLDHNLEFVNCGSGR